MSVATSIKETLINRINALSTTQSVYGYARNNPEGWPAVLVLPADLEGEFTSNTENARNYAYHIFVMYPVGKELPLDEAGALPRNEVAEKEIATVLDDIIDDIDKNFELPGNASVLFANAGNATWGFVEYEGGVAKACNITYVIRTDFNVNS